MAELCNKWLDVDNDINFNKKYRIAEYDNKFWIEKYTYVKPQTFATKLKEFYYGKNYKWLPLELINLGLMKKTYNSLEDAKVSLLAVKLKNLNIVKEMETKYHYL